jgi:predicted anti-sigma-YlaC factor YlaD
MNCKELVELVTDYLEEKLSAADVVRFEQHLSSCNGCRRYLDQMKQTIQVVGFAPRDALTTQQWQDLLSIFRDWKNG